MIEGHDTQENRRVKRYKGIKNEKGKKGKALLRHALVSWTRACAFSGVKQNTEQWRCKRVERKNTEKRARGKKRWGGAGEKRKILSGRAPFFREG